MAYLLPRDQVRAVEDRDAGEVLEAAGHEVGGVTHPADARVRVETGDDRVRVCHGSTRLRHEVSRQVDGRLPQGLGRPKWRWVSLARGRTSLHEVDWQNQVADLIGVIDLLEQHVQCSGGDSGDGLTDGCQWRVRRGRRVEVVKAHDRYVVRNAYTSGLECTERTDRHHVGCDEDAVELLRHQRGGEHLTAVLGVVALADKLGVELQPGFGECLAETGGAISSGLGVFWAADEGNSPASDRSEVLAGQPPTGLVVDVDRAEGIGKRVGAHGDGRNVEVHEPVQQRVMRVVRRHEHPVHSPGPDHPIDETVLVRLFVEEEQRNGQVLSRALVREALKQGDEVRVLDHRRRAYRDDEPDQPASVGDQRPGGRQWAVPGLLNHLFNPRTYRRTYLA